MQHKLSFPKKKNFLNLYVFHNIRVFNHLLYPCFHLFQKIDYLREYVQSWTNYFIETKAKCDYLKNLPVKGLCGRCLSEFIDWR